MRKLSWLERGDTRAMADLNATGNSFGKRDGDPLPQPGVGSDAGLAPSARGPVLLCLSRALFPGSIAEQDIGLAVGRSTLGFSTCLLVAGQEHILLGGLGGAVGEFLPRPQPRTPGRIEVRDVYAESASNDDLLEKYGVTAWRAAETAWLHLAKWLG